jgi:glycine/D-amino acid oxidase-like deaminating enzyme
MPDLPARADALVVGSGYTGLNAALVLARAGRHTVVVDAEGAGWGCSTRNGGQVGTGVKPSLEALAARHGRARAEALTEEGRRALAFIGDFIAGERIDCGFRICGRFMGAHGRAAFERLARQAAADPSHSVRLVPRAEQHAEIGTDAYHGGLVQTRHAALDPARYHQGLLERALAAGALVIPHCRATAIAGEAGSWRLATSRGTIAARRIAIATNGYSGALVPWLARRVIPIGSYIIATEPIETALMDRLLPTDRMVVDTRRVVYYYRASPDRRRILFGGRVYAAETDPRRSAAPLRAELVRIFPELAPVRVSRSWLGLVAYTFDTLPHVGMREGIHYALGYCGSGIAMASWLGRRLGTLMLGGPEPGTAFEGLPFPTRPLYSGRPWFLPAAVAWYRWRDRWDGR